MPSLARNKMKTPFCVLVDSEEQKQQALERMKLEIEALKKEIGLLTCRLATAVFLKNSSQLTLGIMQTAVRELNE
jgi:cell division protein FtsB